MLNSETRFSLDLQKAQSQVSIPVMLGDTAKSLIISLNDGGEPYYIKNGVLAMISIKRPMETILQEFCIIIDNTTIRYDFSQNESTAAVEGPHNCEITLIGTDGRRLSSAWFTMVVSSNVVDRDDINLSDDDYTALNAMLAKEAERESAESERIAAEDLRDAAEDQREVTEGLRESAEEIRVSSEKDRKNAEALRETAEIERETFVSAFTKEINAQVELIIAIAKLINLAKGFNDYRTLVDDLNEANDNAYKVGQSLFIVTKGVPDVWVVSVEKESVYYSYIDDDTIARELEINGTIQIGNGWIKVPPDSDVELMEFRCRLDEAENNIDELSNIFDTNSLNFII